MGLDVGEYRTGVAISEPMGLLARSLAIIQSRRWSVQVSQIADLAIQHEVGTIVIGYPLHMSGQAGEQAKRVDRFAEMLADELERRGWAAQLVFWDERLSTEVARDIRRESSPRVAGRGRHARVDAAAAAVILQGYLDRVLANQINP